MKLINMFNNSFKFYILLELTSHDVLNLLYVRLPLLLERQIGDPPKKKLINKKKIMKICQLIYLKLK